MATHKALVLPEKFGKFVVRDVPTPKAGPGELLVEVRATSLNPIDWKAQEYGIAITEYPAVLGLDAAGVVKEVGEGVAGFAAGDQVLYQGSIAITQANFQQYSIVPAEITAKLPSNFTLEQAAAIPSVFITAAFGLYNGQTATGELRGAGLTPPWEEGGRSKYAGTPILIIGGSSSVGQQVIQLAKLSGFSPIIATASLKNTDFLKSLGATHVIDRNAPLAPSVKAIISEPIKYIYEAISLKETQDAAYELLAPGGTLILVLPTVLDEKNADKSKILAQVFASAHDPKQRKAGVKLYKNLTALLESGAIKPNHVEVLPNGLSGIPEGLERLKADKVSATKLVAQPWA
ncbi:medium-chain dehydrogenase/reductase like protein [Irpex rosettiformis]|uniref:Medium-chain dehydrogenase/reductase like protein n=1 Tax=Irpex rosettiformis TaxID=378272 RepID=A0ACB8UA62_9APHY|nr:medium-chain dehydrogenase/reductase like protein [Irpex rosettiformis]